MKEIIILIRVERPFYAIKIMLEKDKLKCILPLKMFRHQNGLVDLKEVPLHWPGLGDENKN